MQTIASLIDRILQNRLLTHFLYWLGIVALWAVPGSFVTHDFEPLVNKLCYLPSQMMATYWLIYDQIPRLIFKGKYFRFLISLLGSAYLTTVLARIMKVYVYESVLGAGLPKDSFLAIFTELPPLVYQYLMWVYLIPIVSLIIKFLKDHFAEKEQFEALQKEKALAELGFLKAQIHPHFLFNTLNNLYTLTLRKSDQTPGIVRKLSDMLAYMFYQCNEPSVLVTQEIALIRNYLDLERLRYGERLDLTFLHEVDNSSAAMAPLVLLSIVENAFKHGASGDVGRPRIHISLRVENKQLHFRVFNTKPAQLQADPTNDKKGIGVSNIKRQLELIYAHDYQLKIEEKNNSYLLDLTINLLEPMLLSTPQIALHGR